jgi:hypothetical protein
VATAEPVVKAEPQVKSEQLAKTEPFKNGNPAWMSRVIPNSAQPHSTTLGVKPAGDFSAFGAAGGGQGVKTAKAASGQVGASLEKETAAAGVASAKAPPVIQLAANSAANPAGGGAATSKPAKGDLSHEGGRPPAEPAKAGAKPISPANAAGQGATAQSATSAVAGKPFLAASPVPSTTQATGSWKTYGGGKSPGGKSVTAEQATSLQGRNDGSPIYLHGRFTVTAAGTNRAVLRQSSGGERKGQPRVIVEYPAGAVPPQQGASVAREDGRGFEIREVRRTPDGQVNIYVREVSAP